MNGRARAPQTGRHWFLPVSSLLSALLLLLATPATAAFAAPEKPIGGALLGSRGVVRPEGMDLPALPKVQAASYVVSDLDTGKVLAAKDPHGRFAPASTLKVLTALSTLPYLRPSQSVHPTLEDMSVDGTKVGVDRRRTYSAHCLYQAMLMMSANDAAATLARAAGGGGTGGQLKTLARMNAEAKRLYAYDTNAKKPTGLDAKGQSSSAYDLTLLFREAMKRQDFRTYTSTKQAKFPDLKHNKTFQIASHDRLLFEYPGMLGGKNGYTTAARASYVGAAKRGGHTIGVALMRSKPDFWDDTRKLLNWGFAARADAVPIGDLVAPQPKPGAAKSASAQQAKDEPTKKQAVAPLDDSTGLPGWLAPLGLAAAVILCALFAGMAITGRRNQPAPARGRGGRRRNSATHTKHAVGAMPTVPARPPAGSRRGHASRKPRGRRASHGRRTTAPESTVTVTYPIWPND